MIRCEYVEKDVPNELADAFVVTLGDVVVSFRGTLSDAAGLSEVVWIIQVQSVEFAKKFGKIGP